MKTSWRYWIVIIVAWAFMPACSQHWIEVDNGVSGRQVIDLIDEITSQGLSGASSSDLQAFLNLKDDPNSTIYFAYGPGEMGPVVSIFSLIRYDFMGLSDTYFDDIESVRIFFIYLPPEAGGGAALMVDLELKDQQFVTKVFSSIGSPEFAGGEFVAVLGENGTEKLVLRSTYVTSKGDDLQSIIQLKVSDFDRNFVEAPNGKFSVLVGYGS